MPLQVLLLWWNLIYVVPFGMALIYLGLFVFTGITFGDADADVDTDVDGDMEADAGTVHVEAHVVDADGDADADHDAGGDHDGDGQGSAVHHGSTMLVHSVDVQGDGEGGHASVMSSFLSFLGVGKIPLSLALMIFLLSWGFSGFAINALLYRWLGASVVVGLISLPVAFAVTLALTGLCAALIGKIIPSDDATRERRQDLVGKAGEAMYDIDSSFGMAAVRGEAGDMFQIPCRTPEGKPRIVKGSRIVLFDYDRESGVFHVAPFDA